MKPKPKVIRAWAVISRENNFIYSHESDRELMTIFHSKSAAELYGHNGICSDGKSVSRIVSVEIRPIHQSRRRKRV